MKVTVRFDVEVDAEAWAEQEQIAVQHVPLDVIDLVYQYTLGCKGISPAVEETS